MFICILTFYYVGYGNEIDFKILSTIDGCHLTDHHDITEILLNVTLNTTPRLHVYKLYLLHFNLLLPYFHQYISGVTDYLFNNDFCFKFPYFHQNIYLKFSRVANDLCSPIT